MSSGKASLEKMEHSCHSHHAAPARSQDLLAPDPKLKMKPCPEMLAVEAGPKNRKG